MCLRVCVCVVRRQHALLDSTRPVPAFPALWSWRRPPHPRWQALVAEVEAEAVCVAAGGQVIGAGHTASTDGFVQLRYSSPRCVLGGGACAWAWACVRWRVRGGAPPWAPPWGRRRKRLAALARARASREVEAGGGLGTCKLSVVAGGTGLG